MKVLDIFFGLLLASLIVEGETLEQPRQTLLDILTGTWSIGAPQGGTSQNIFLLGHAIPFTSSSTVNTFKSKIAINGFYHDFYKPKNMNIILLFK